MIKLPGLIDPHVHLREPGATHKEDYRLWHICRAGRRDHNRAGDAKHQAADL